jgi:hypothetical protein
MKMPTSNVGRFFFYFCAQFTSYALVVANGRAFVIGYYGWTAITDASIAALNFIVLRKMMKDSGDELHGPSLAGYVIGGTLGSLFSIWITKIVYGQ